jgi:hypothetical protein
VRNSSYAPASLAKTIQVRELWITIALGRLDPVSTLIQGDSLSKENTSCPP